VGSHAGFLQAAGAGKELVDAVAQNELDKVTLNDKERSLLDFVRILTVEPWMTRDAHVVRMRKAGWTDEEIFEAAFDASLFAFFNRMADAYGLDYPEGGWLPPSLQPRP
jgi:alkylhydroperoxidase family enzyme